MNINDIIETLTKFKKFQKDERYSIKNDIRIPLYINLISHIQHKNDHKNSGFPYGNSAVLYNKLFYSIRHGKYVDNDEIKSNNDIDLKTSFYYEKWVLRRLAALHQLYQKLSADEISKFLLYIDKRHEINNGLVKWKDFSEKELKHILDSYFYSQSGSYKFLSDTLRRYFLAEYYLESLLTYKWWRVNVGIPDISTIIIFEDMLELFHESKRRKSEGQLTQESIVFFRNTRCDILKSVYYFSDINQLPDPEREKERLINNIEYYFDSYSIPSQIEGISAKESWSVIDLKDKTNDYDDKAYYASLTQIHRILLILVNQIYEEDQIDPIFSMDSGQKATSISEKLRFIIKSAPYLGTYFKRFSKIHFIPGMDLSRSILSGAALKSCKLIASNLRGADLSDTDLRGADLSGADLRGADLSGADFDTPFLPPITESNHVTEHGHKHLGAKLIGANLSGADISGTNLQNADLSYAVLIGCDFDDDVAVFNTKIENCITDNSTLYNKIENGPAGGLGYLAQTRKELQDRLGKHYKELIDYIDKNKSFYDYKENEYKNLNCQFEEQSSDSNRSITIRYSYLL